jgi:hypothetical protein
MLGWIQLHTTPGLKKCLSLMVTGKLGIEFSYFLIMLVLGTPFLKFAKSIKTKRPKYFDDFSVLVEIQQIMIFPKMRG